MHEGVQLVLAVEIVLGSDHELLDFVLEVDWQFDVAHRLGGHVDLILKLLMSAVQGGHDDCDGTNNVSDLDGTHDAEEASRHDVSVTLRKNVIARK